MAMKRCVVVGNGPSVLGSGLGEVIDTYEDVVRINNFVTEGFEEDVGKKTTTWGLSGHRIEPRDTSDFHRIVALVGTSQAATAWHGTWDGVVAMGAPTCAYTSHRFMKSLEREVGHRRLSSGVTMVGFLLEEYRQVAIAGFDHFMAKTHHYSNDHPRPPGCPHTGAIEKVWFEKRIKEGKIIRL